MTAAQLYRGIATGLALAALTLSTLTDAQGQVPAYTFVDLGTISNLNTSATGINDTGQITGQSSDGTNDRAFRITPVLSNGVLTWFMGSGNINSLMVLTTQGLPNSTSSGINNKGELAGQATGAADTWPQSAYFWRTDLSGTQLAASSSSSHAINDKSSVAGNSSGAKSGSAGTIWRLTNGNSTATTFPLPSGYSGGSAVGLNNLDQVVGQIAQSGNPGLLQPYVWLPAASYSLPAGLNLLPWTSSGSSSQAYAVATGINDTGCIIGYTAPGTGGTHAVMWNPNGSGFSFSNLVGSDLSNSYPYGITNPNPGDLLKVVGFATHASGGSQCALVWDSVNGMRDLNLLTVNAPQGGLSQALAVNKGGLIVGFFTLVQPALSGVVGAQPFRAFLLVPNNTLPAATVVPNAPINATGVGGADQIQLSWSDGSTTFGSADENGFQICKSINGTYFPQIATTVTSVTSFTDTFRDRAYAPAFKYYYHIRAYNVAGYSDAASCEVVTPGAPLAPSGVSASAISGPIRVNLSWTNNSNTQDNVYVERSNDGVSFTPLATLAGTVRSYSDTAVVVNHTYYYRVRAHSTNGLTSAYSAVVSAITPRK